MSGKHDLSSVLSDTTKTRSPRRPMITRFEGCERLSNVVSIELRRIDADSQTRTHFDDQSLIELAGSLKQHGQLQPIRVRWDESRSKYTVITGERRLRAARIAGLPSLDCVVADGLSEDTLLVQQIVENVQRDDLKPVEQAHAFQQLMDVKGWSAREVSKELRMPRSNVQRALMLLELPEDVQAKVDAGTLAVSNALKMLKSDDATPAKKRPARELKLRTSIGTVTLKARRNLDTQLFAAALREALDDLESNAA